MTAGFHTPPDRITLLHAIRDRNKGDASATQRARLLEALEVAGHVTTFEAMRYLDIFDPRPRKLELMRLGHPIVTTRRVVLTESGERHMVGVYTLERAARTAHPSLFPMGEAPTGASGRGPDRKSQDNDGDSDAGTVGGQLRPGRRPHGSSATEVRA